MIARIADALDRFLCNLAAAALAGILCVILWQVVSRSLLGTPSSFTGEIARFFGIWLGLLAAGAALGRGSHVALHGLAEHEKLRWAHFSKRFAAIAGLVFSSVVLVAGGLRLITVTLEVGPQSAATGIPIAAVYAALPVAGMAMMLRSLSSLQKAKSPPTEREP